MNPIVRCVSATLLSCLPLCGQGHTIFFTMSGNESTASGSGGVGRLAVISKRGLGIVTPMPGSYSAEKYLSARSWEAMIGDDDGDALLLNSLVFGTGIDALLVPHALGGTSVDPTSLYFSPAGDVGTTVSGAPGLRAGDLGVFTQIGGADGAVRHFLTAEQVQQALGLTVPVSDIDIDAACQDTTGNVFLSLETDATVHLFDGSGVVPFLLEDGAVAMIPAVDITYAPDGTVAAVNMHSGMLIYSEATMDSFVANASIADETGACASAIMDLDALEVDASGALAQVQFGRRTATIPQLVFSGSRLTGGALLTTAGSGMVYHVAGIPMGGPCGGGSTSGSHLGLATAVTHSVNGLAFVRDRPAHGVLEGTPYVAGAGTAQIAVRVDPGSLPGTALAFVLVGLQPSAVGMVPATTPASPLGTAVGFPYIYSAVLGGPVTFAVPLDPVTGTSVLTLPIPPGHAGLSLVFQAAALPPGLPAGSFALSTGAVVQLLP